MAIAFNMGTDLQGILSNPIGQPLATVSQIILWCNVVITCCAAKIFYNSFGRNGTLALWSCIIVVQ